MSLIVSRCYSDHLELTSISDTGRRSDSAHAYIHSTRSVHQNLHLVVNTKVEKIVLEGGRAVGVKTVPTKPLSPGQDVSKTYRARKQIVVSGGTLSSPLILQRSGIGTFDMSVVDESHPLIQPLR